MHIKIIGARALNPIESKYAKKFASAVFISGNKSVQIDAGNKLTFKPDLLLITHIHEDHMGQIKTAFKGTKCCVPAKEFIKKLLKLNKNLAYCFFEPQKPFNFYNFKITAFPVIHSKYTKTFGFRIEAENKKIVWLPDYRRLEGTLKYLENLDILFIGASTLSRNIVHRNADITGQLAIKNTLKILRNNKIYPRKIMLMHLGKTMAPVPEKIKYLQKLYPMFEIGFCYDNMRINL